MKRLLWLVLCVMVSAPTANAGEQHDLLGIGNTTCAQLAKEFKRNPDVTDAVYFHWYAGFISGANLIWGSTRGVSKDVGAANSKNKMQQLRSYCDEHPLLRFQDAVMNDYISLPAFRVD